MRLVIDSLIALMLVALLAAVLFHYREQQQQLDRLRLAHRSLARLHEQIVYQGALATMPASHHGFPLTVSPLWFDGDLPENPLVPGRQPWIDVAREGDMADHPPDIVTERQDQAGFWYNPNRGIFRARVAAQFTDEQTLELYNQVNATGLRSLPRTADPARQPQPLDIRLAALGVLESAGDAGQGAPGSRDPAAPPPRPRLRPTLLTQPRPN